MSELDALELDALEQALIPGLGRAAHDIAVDALAHLSLTGWHLAELGACMVCDLPQGNAVHRLDTYPANQHHEYWSTD